MKHFVVLLSLLIAMVQTRYVSGQTNIAGVYNRSHQGDPLGASYLYVLDNHKFVVTYFGGALTGSWSFIRENVVEFKPFVSPEQFKIYGRHHKALGDSCRIFFRGFYDEETFIGFDQIAQEKPVLRRVFNPSPNCFSYPYVFKFTKVPGQLSFSDKLFAYDKEENQKQVLRAIYGFDNPENYNDFVAYYMKTRSDDRPFYAMVKDNQLYFDKMNPSKRGPLPEKGEDLEFINFIAASPGIPKEVFYSPFYKESDEDVTHDEMNWKFNEQKNAWINFLNYHEGEELVNRDQYDYNRVVILYQYRELPVSSQIIKPFVIDPQAPLFIVKCKD